MIFPVRQNSMWSSQVQSAFVMYGQIRAMHMMRVSATLLLGIFLCLVTTAAHSQSPTDSAYTEVFYPSGNLRIQAYLYKPDGDGPFQVVIYNHGASGARCRSSLSAGC
jgi:hypothetical protein